MRNVLAWLFAQEGFDRDEKEAQLLSQIDAQKNPVSVTGTPW
jgi:hypothetical protein